MSSSIAVRVLIEGKVQKVGFREWTRKEASALNIQGWVRNKSDGMVEALFIGDKNTVSSFIARCYHGPSLAQVKRVREFPQDDAPAAEGFTILPTV